MNNIVAERNQQLAFGLSNNLHRVIREWERDFSRRTLEKLAERGYPDIRSSHGVVIANLGTGAVRVTELAERAQVTQQAMGKILKELERMGYVIRDVDSSDKRAREIRFTDKGMQLVTDCLAINKELREYYADKIGADKLDRLEKLLREAVDSLELEYMPEAWVSPRP